MAKHPKPKDPVTLAKTAVAAVLDRAIASRDDDRILASAKQVLAMLDKPEADVNLKADRLDVNTLTEEEFHELQALLDPLDRFEAKVRARLGRDATCPPLALRSDNSSDS
jgi:hypothetical protein